MAGHHVNALKNPKEHFAYHCTEEGCKEYLFGVYCPIDKKTGKQKFPKHRCPVHGRLMGRAVYHAPLARFNWLCD